MDPPIRSTSLEISPNPSHQLTISVASNNNSSSTAANSQESQLSISSNNPVQIEGHASRPFTVDDINEAPDYEVYVRTLAEQKYPSLNLVLEFLKSTSEHGSRELCSKTEDSCILCHYFRLNVTTVFADGTYGELCAFDKHTEEPSRLLVNQMLHGVIEFAQSSQPKQPQRLIILVEDIRPRGMKLLGTFLNIDPRIFERLLNFGREYANGLVGVHVLDYCQGYFYRNASGQKHLLDFEDDILERSKIHGKLRRWWRDVVGHQQRIVLATLPKTDLVTVPIDIIFFQALPLRASLQFKSTEFTGTKHSFQLQYFEPLHEFPTFNDFRRRKNPGNLVTALQKETGDNMAAVKLSLCYALEDKNIPENLKSLSAALSFITEKWTSLIDQTHEVISETDVPDGTDLRLLRIMTKRKHMFSEIRRTLAGVAQSITAPELSKARYSLEKVTKKLDDWVRDLESTISLCSNYLSLDESQRAITQSTRTAQLTVLAFVFIPISTVASGFGMNVNVLNDNPPIYWFAGTGVVVALITFLYAVFFQHINRGLALGCIYSSSLALDVIFLILKVLAALIWSVVITLSTPFWVFVFFMIHFKTPKNVWTAVFTVIPDIVWYLISVYWDEWVRILQWSPLALDLRLEWRARRTLPHVELLYPELGLTESKPGSGDRPCIVM